MLKPVVTKGVMLLSVIGMDSRGISDDELMAGATRSSMDDLAEAALAADKVLVF